MAGMPETNIDTPPRPAHTDTQDARLAAKLTLRDRAQAVVRAY
jgi:hypothetical protein